jgi:histidine triad (HIT) family protein
MRCNFCNTSDDPDNQIHFRNELVFFCENRKFQGSLKHSGCIVPIKHRETVFDLTKKEILATFEMLAQVKSWFDTEHQPEGYNVGWNCYKTGGQVFPYHAHLHVIPRFSQEPLANKGIRTLLKSDKNKW